MTEAAAFTRDDRITTAALELLRTRGPRAVTIEAVTAVSGVAKTTIYRRYRDRNAMLIAALASVTQPAPPPAYDGSLVPILEWLIDQSAHAIEGGIGVGGVAALLTEDDREFTDLIRSLLVHHRRTLMDALREVASAHPLRDDLDLDTILDCTVGAYLAERARTGTVRAGWSQRILRILLPAFTPTNHDGPDGA